MTEKTKYEKETNNPFDVAPPPVPQEQKQIIQDIIVLNVHL